MWSNPGPPSVSGNATPVRPSSAAFLKSPSGKWPFPSFSLASGRTSDSANSRTLFCNSCCSSVSSKFKGLASHKHLSVPVHGNKNCTVGCELSDSQALPDFADLHRVARGVNRENHNQFLAAHPACDRMHCCPGAKLIVAILEVGSYPCAAATKFLNGCGQRWE